MNGKNFLRASVVALVLANLAPLAGVAFLGWSLRSILLLYWLESAVIGLLNAVKMGIVGGLKTIPLIIFFAVHYGIFMAVHLVFILVLTSGMFFGGGGAPHRNPMAEGLRAAADPVLLAALLGFFVSHGISFFQNFLGLREYEKTDAAKQMFSPYGRIVVMHLSILFGAFLMTALGTPAPLLILLVILKTAVDLHAHRREHSLGARGPSPVG